MNTLPIFHSDPGHGWLEIPRAELARLGIADKITRYSYVSRDGATVYLEEDCDLTTYCRAAGIAPGGLRCTERSYNGDAFIRNLPRYVAPSRRRSLTRASVADHSTVSTCTATRTRDCKEHHMGARTNRTMAREDLIAFARWTLDHLERNEEWSSDTLDEVAIMAQNLKLARLDRHGMFKRVPLPSLD